MTYVQITPNVRVETYRIIGTKTQVYVAVEPSNGIGLESHSSLCTFDDFQDTKTWWGKITSRPLPAELNALPAWSKEHSEAVGKWQNHNNIEALSYIYQAFPHLVNNPNATPSTWAGEIVETVN